MAERFKTTVHDLSAADQRCPRCGKPYTPVEYYTGRRVSESSARVGYSQVRTTTTYRDVQRHTGGICRWCDAQKQRRTLMKMIYAGAAGTAMLIVGILMLTNVIALDPMKYGGLGILLVSIGGLAWLVGVIAVAVLAMMNPAGKINYISLYTMFTDRLGKEGGKRSGLTYLTADEGRRLEPVRR